MLTKQHSRVQRWLHTRAERTALRPQAFGNHAGTAGKLNEDGQKHEQAEISTLASQNPTAVLQPRTHELRCHAQTEGGDTQES